MNKPDSFHAISLSNISNYVLNEFGAISSCRKTRQNGTKIVEIHNITIILVAQKVFDALFCGFYENITHFAPSRPLSAVG